MQAIDENAYHIPTVALRADGKRWLVVMYLDDWIRIAREEIVKGDANGNHD